MPTTLLESRDLTEAATPATGPGRLLIRLIDAGRGSSGVYPAETLKAAAEARIFKAGTQMHLDHQTDTEAFERPAGSLQTLAAVLAEDARWDEAAQALVAEARVYSRYRTMLAEMAPDIGVSIRAMAETEPGTFEGEPAMFVTRLTHANSVDFVTHAGRGGKVLEVLEAATVEEARNVGTWVESRIHLDFTRTADEMFGDGRLTREERIALSGAIGDALNVFVTRLEADAPALYLRDVWADPAVAPVTPTTEAAEAAPTSVPVIPAGQSTTTSQEDTMPQIEEARLRQLEEAHGRVPALESDLANAKRATEAAEQRALQAEAGTYARDLARNLVTKANGDLAEASVARIVRDALAKPLPLEESGRLDVAAFTPTVEEARTAEETYLAQVAEASGVGSVRGVGSTTTQSAPVSEADVDKAVASAFGRKGA